MFTKGARMAEHDAVIVGAGPTGLMLAGELALTGMDVAVIERRLDRNLVGSRAGGMTPRTIEVLDQRGIAVWPGRGAGWNPWLLSPFRGAFGTLCSPRPPNSARI
jgi:glycine/D-amino acid oxidase-like deaminating enzyme